MRWPGGWPSRRWAWGCSPVVHLAERCAERTPACRLDAGGGGRQDRAGGDEGSPPPVGHRAGDRRRQGDHHQGVRRVDDRRARHDRHALPQRRRRHLLRLHAAARARRREEGQPRRQGLEVAAGDPPQRRGHARPARPDDLRLHRLRDRERGSRRHALRRPVPPVDARRTPAHGDVEAAAVPAGHELELRPHQLRDPRPGAREGHREADGRLMQEKVLGPLGLTNTPTARSTPASPSPRCTPSPPNAVAAGHPGGNPLLRGIDVLEPVVDDHPGRHPDDEHLRRERDGRRDRDGQAAVAGVVRDDGLDGPARARPRRCPGAPPASRRATATATGWASSRPATG